jgi:hypothetical protein
MITFEPFVWKSEPPEDIPFQQSHELEGIRFLGRCSDYSAGDTWYPSWASDDALYSPWTDGTTNGVESMSEAFRIYADGKIEPRQAMTAHARLIGDDPLHLQIEHIGLHQADPYPYGGRYPCGSLVYNGIWYYGTYCLGPYGIMKYGNTAYNWPWLGPFVGFRVSEDFGATWTDTLHTPEKPLFGETGMYGYPVKIGAPHFVDFGKNMEHSPDGKAYMVAHGSDISLYPNRFEANSWITGDQIYLLRVTPGIAEMNDPNAYEFFAGHDVDGNPRWSRDFNEIRPLLEWKNNMGCVTITYHPHLKKYLMCVTDGQNTCAKMNSYILESDRITGPWRLVTYMKNFGEQAYFLNFPSKFISVGRTTMWLCYSGNFAVGWNGVEITEKPPGSRYGLVLQEVEVICGNK